MIEKDKEKKRLRVQRAVIILTFGLCLQFLVAPVTWINISSEVGLLFGVVGMSLSILGAMLARRAVATLRD